MPLNALLAAAPKGPLDTWSPTFFSGWTLFLPLIAVLIILTFTIDSRRLSAGLSVLFALAAFACAVVLLAIEIAHPGYHEHTNQFLQFFTGQSGVAGEFRLEWGFLADPLAAVMLFMVTSVNLFVQVAALGYMRREDGVVRFFLFASLLSFAMSGVILSTNYAELFFFWELLSVGTYLLVAHWWQREAAARAAKKAFIVMQVGDIGLLAGIMYIFFRFHELNFHTLAPQYAAGKVGVNGLFVMSLLVFLGAVGKSAQLPLHTWLPDSAEAPAPAAALIQAAMTAVAGIYLVARTYALFHASPRAMMVVGIVGGATGIVGALWALGANNLKRLIAYATMSELGLALLALAAGAYSAGTFHLFTHGWSTALLLLGAGVIVRELRTETMSEMGGLWRRMRLTGSLTLVGAATVGGIPPFSGFTSKDAIVTRLLQQGNTLVAGVALLVIFLAGLYMFRMFFTVFAGATARRRRFEPERIRDASGRIVVGMILLALFAALIGLHDLARVATEFTRFVTFPGQTLSHAASQNGSLLTGAAAVLGLAAGWLFYGRRAASAQARAGRMPWVQRTLVRGFYLDDAYRWGIENGLLRLAAGLSWIDRVVVDGFIDRFGESMAAITAPARWLPELRLPQFALGFFVGLLMLALLTAALAGHGLKG